MKFLAAPGTIVSGSFDAVRIPAPVIIGILGTYVHDSTVVAAAKKAKILLIVPSGAVVQSSAVPTGVTLLSGGAASKLATKDGDAFLGQSGEVKEDEPEEEEN